MTGFKTITCINISTDSDNVTVRRKTYRITWLISCGFSINIISNLCPAIICILINPYMTASLTVAIIFTSTNCNNGTVRRKTYWLTWIISCSFSINISSNLGPCIIYDLINPYMTTIFSIPIIQLSTNSYNWTIRRKTYWTSWIIICRFSINILT